MTGRPGPRPGPRTIQGMRFRRRPRPAASLAAAAALAAVAGVAGWAPASARSGDERAVVTGDGWWSAAPGLPTTVGDGGLGVGARGGEADKVAALAIEVAAGAGRAVAGLTLRLAEVDEPGGVLPPGAAGAAVRACPATAPWAPGRNAPLAAAPAHDCGPVSAAGTRGADGSWTFDLTAAARAWEDGSLGAHGVVLVEDSAPPASFQVAFRDTASGGPRLVLATSPATSPARTDPAAGPAPTAVAIGPGGNGMPVPGPVAALGAEEPAGTPAGGGAPPPVPTAVPVLRTAGRVGAGPGGPPPSALLLVPAALALAAATSLTVGAERTPDEGRVRPGPVSRALADRRRAGDRS